MILDTNAVSALLAGDPALGEMLAGVERPALPVIVVGEYRFGVQRSRHRRRLGGLLDRLVASARVLDVDLGTAAVYATTRDALRVAGKPIPENDLWIASLALQHGLPVATRDSDFDRVPGLRRLAW